MIAPHAQRLLEEAGQVLLLGSGGVLALLLMIGVGVYLSLCWRSSRQWDGFEQRWARPSGRQ